ncbi:PiggyBac transposable element-derived protein 4-like 13 [Homarus americanus]|uniref:PiggyBac transposable element-derived protein 4-like 13 n=1 Tax=Homarus americanus TaxID=6706 RepID=A0A8J5N8Z4_HOMAM|nr:PiggyBac transposable element-derived protein 4-like 13 [Homarus americanus]
MGLEVDDDDVEELVEEHSKELSTEELLELHKEENETLKRSLTSEESGEEDKEESRIIPAKDLKDAFFCWSKLSKLAEDYHPDVGSVQKAISVFNDNVMNYFCKSPRHLLDSPSHLDSPASPTVPLHHLQFPCITSGFPCITSSSPASPTRSPASPSPVTTVPLISGSPASPRSPCITYSSPASPHRPPASPILPFPTPVPHHPVPTSPRSLHHLVPLHHLPTSPIPLVLPFKLLSMFHLSKHMGWASLPLHHVLELGSKMSVPESDIESKRILELYDKHRRLFSWRAESIKESSLSDIMAFSSVTPQMSSSTEDSEYEPSLRSLNTSDNSASSSDNDYFSTSEEEEEEGEGRAWRSLELSEERMNTPPPRFPFTGNPGIKIDENPAELSPFEFFSLFIDKRIIDSVLVETNRFAEQTGQDDSLWRPVTEAELFVFFAMKMLGGIVKMPEEEMNWSHDELLERPIFRQLMTMKCPVTVSSSPFPSISAQPSDSVKPLSLPFLHSPVTVSGSLPLPFLHSPVTVSSSPLPSIPAQSSDNMSHKEQLSVTLRIVSLEDTPQIKEYFMGFLVAEKSTGASLSSIILKRLDELNIPSEDCRGKLYDNGANMRGKNKDAQVRLLQQNSRAPFVPCGAHTLNLLVTDAAKSSPDAIGYFGYLMKLFTLFSGSTQRWAILSKHVKTTQKSWSETRWESKTTAKEICKEMNVGTLLKQKRLRSTKRYFSYESVDEPISDALKKMEITFFNVVVVPAISSLDERFQTLGEVNAMFRVLHNFIIKSEEDLMQQCETLSNTLTSQGWSDIDGRELAVNCKIFHIYHQVTRTTMELLTFLHEKKPVEIYPNMWVGLRISAIFLVTVAASERSFSKPK